MTGKLVYVRTTNRASDGMNYELVETVTYFCFLQVMHSHFRKSQRRPVINNCQALYLRKTNVQ